jgi:hypothetical protein
MKWEKTKQLIKKTSAIIASFALLIGIQAMAAPSSTMNQAINAGSKSVDIVDSGGTPVGSPAVTFTAITFSFDTQDSNNAVLGTSSERIRAYNPTNDQTLTVSLAGSATTAVWTNGSETYDFNDGSGYTDGSDADSVGGQLSVDASGGTLAGVSGCATSNVSKGSASSFVEGGGSPVASIDLITSTSNAANKRCRWDLTGVDLDQKIPAAQATGSYTLTLTLSIV